MDISADRRAPPYTNRIRVRRYGSVRLQPVPHPYRTITSNPPIRYGYGACLTTVNGCGWRTCGLARTVVKQEDAEDGRTRGDGKTGQEAREDAAGGVDERGWETGKQDEEETKRQCEKRGHGRRDANEGARADSGAGRGARNGDKDRNEDENWRPGEHGRRGRGGGKSEGEREVHAGRKGGRRTPRGGGMMETIPNGRRARAECRRSWWSAQDEGGDGAGGHEDAHGRDEAQRKEGRRTWAGGRTTRAHETRTGEGRPCGGKRAGSSDGRARGKWMERDEEGARRKSVPKNRANHSRQIPIQNRVSMIAVLLARARRTSAVDRREEAATSGAVEITTAVHALPAHFNSSAQQHSLQLTVLVFLPQFFTAVLQPFKVYIFVYMFE
ncbi:hypothetical protein FB451DRAFT_1430977 [Mycena latifolia]|nr:hypothetical protein FB451DRAFT_1430977 [Mycena latifolia]